MKSGGGPGELVPVYEDLLDRNGTWALREGSRHFEQKNAVHDALDRIARRFDDLEIAYAVAGGMALFKHGFRRFTEHVVILVTRDGLSAIHSHLESLGYVPPFERSRNLRDTENGVLIEFLVTGEFPGDGKPKPVAFPDPGQAGINIDGVCYLTLPNLVELKLASGMTGAIHRLKDLSDVVQLIESRQLPADFALSLDPFVRDKYLELWQGIQESPPGPGQR